LNFVKGEQMKKILTCTCKYTV